jgi:hypothetical protein
VTVVVIVTVADATAVLLFHVFSTVQVQVLHVSTELCCVWWL